MQAKAKSNILIIISFIAFALTSSPCFGEVVVTTKTKYYSVEGKHRSDITASLKANALHEEDGEIAPAFTTIDIKYQYGWRPIDDRCSIEDVTVKLNLTYTYPKLVSKPDNNTLLWWDAKIMNFEEHELIHGDIAKKYATMLDKELGKLKDLNCSTVKEVVKARVNYVMRKMKARQAEYDRVTDHGRKQDKFRGI